MCLYFFMESTSSNTNVRQNQVILLKMEPQLVRLRFAPSQAQNASYEIPRVFSAVKTPHVLQDQFRMPCWTAQE